MRGMRIAAAVTCVVALAAGCKSSHDGGSNTAAKANKPAAVSSIRPNVVTSVQCPSDGSGKFVTATETITGKQSSQANGQDDTLSPVTVTNDESHRSNDGCAFFIEAKRASTRLFVVRQQNNGGTWWAITATYDGEQLKSMRDKGQAVYTIEANPAVSFLIYAHDASLPEASGPSIDTTASNTRTSDEAIAAYNKQIARLNSLAMTKKLGNHFTTTGTE